MHDDCISSAEEKSCFCVLPFVCNIAGKVKSRFWWIFCRSCMLMSQEGIDKILLVIGCFCGFRLIWDCLPLGNNYSVDWDFVVFASWQHHYRWRFGHFFECMFINNISWVLVVTGGKTDCRFCLTLVCCLYLGYICQVSTTHIFAIEVNFVSRGKKLK